MPARAGIIAAAKARFVEIALVNQGSNQIERARSGPTKPVRDFRQSRGLAPHGKKLQQIHDVRRLPYLQLYLDPLIEMACRMFNILSRLIIIMNTNKAESEGRHSASGLYEIFFFNYHMDN